jgi:Ala-tRNA(Pro) deacylase
MRTRLKDYLDSEGIRYVSIEHSPAFTIQEVAASTHVPGNQMAKTVIVDLDGEMAMAVLPANKKVILQDLRDLTGSERATFAPETEFYRKFPDCEIGAMPPFGNLYGMEVYVAQSLANNDEIAFNAGTHTEIIKMSFADFERLVQPRIFGFTI